MLIFGDSGISSGIGPLPIVWRMIASVTDRDNDFVRTFRMQPSNPKLPTRSIAKGLGVKRFLRVPFVFFVVHAFADLSLLAQQMRGNFYCDMTMSSKCVDFSSSYRQTAQFARYPPPGQQVGPVVTVVGGRGLAQEPFALCAQTGSPIHSIRRWRR